MTVRRKARDAHHLGLRPSTICDPGVHDSTFHGPPDTSTDGSKALKPWFHPTRSAMWEGRRSSNSDSQSAKGVRNTTVTVRP